MYLRKFNILLLLLSLAGAAIGCIVGELLLAWGESKLPNVILIGIYIGQLAMWICLGILIAEATSPQINGHYWKKNNLQSAFKLVIPVSLILLLLSGIIFQFLYGITTNKEKSPNQFVILLDNSESMIQTDPNEESAKAVITFIDELKADKRVAIVLFNHEAEIIQPMVDVTNTTKQQIISKLQLKETPNGATDFTVALQIALGEVNKPENQSHATQFILLSDGYSDINLNEALQSIKDKKIAVSTIGMNMFEIEGNRILKSIAQETKGTFYLVDEISEIGHAISTIYKNSQHWHLFNERIATYADTLYYKVMRVVAFTAFGLLIGLALGMIFDNRHIAKSFIVGGAISGLFAGLFIEYMFSQFSFMDWFIRLVTAMILAFILSLSTVIVPFMRVNEIDLSSATFANSQRKNQVRANLRNQHRI